MLIGMTAIGCILWSGFHLWRILFKLIALI